MSSLLSDKLQLVVARDQLLPSYVTSSCRCARPTLASARDKLKFVGQSRDKLKFVGRSCDKLKFVGQ